MKVASALCALIALVVLVFVLWIVPGDRSELAVQPGAGDLRASSPAKSMASERGRTQVFAGGETEPRKGAGEAAAPSLLDCLYVEDLPAREACAREVLAKGARGAAELGQALCEDIARGGKAESARSLLAACIDAWRYEPIFERLDQVRAACPGWRIDDLIAAVVLELRESDPQLFAALADELTPNSIYDSERTPLGVILAGRLAELDGREGLAALILEGATGLHGGSPAQVDLSILEGAKLLPAREQELDLVRSVLESTTLPEGCFQEGLGSSLVHILLGADAASSSVDAAATLEALVELLEHEVLGGSAAVHVLKHVEVPPSICDAETWLALQDQARAVAASFGLQVQ